MTRVAILRVLAPVLLVMLALVACGDDDRYSRSGPIGPRGTALPPPDPVTGAARTELPAR
ncbi:hypothetical protein KPL78_11640 [Roseomonas sp. HJA6]|uniref:Argininosuccinate lyase n=1 Tax=Roseomonas alba TaxID=2846776 RepID=A0ABS7A882_9PROT|nr:hypothetical protein [Neoroseomonas alba]MBW6398506.1 hypothetical protein [Neoroseomonas alba]